MGAADGFGHDGGVNQILALDAGKRVVILATCVLRLLTRASILKDKSICRLKHQLCSFRSDSCSMHPVEVLTKSSVFIHRSGVWHMEKAIIQDVGIVNLESYRLVFLNQRALEA